MKRILIAVVIVAATALMAADAAREKKLQQAIDLLETKGDASGAVALLEDVAKSSDKTVAARGLLYLGQAQERQGGDRARATYQRIVREFGNQRELVAEAQRRLGSLGGVAQGIQVRKQSLPPSEFSYDNVQADGQWFGGTDWSTGDMVMVRTATGEVRRLAAGTPENSRYGEQPLISPDGRQIVFSWYDEKTDDGVRILPNGLRAGNFHSLRIMPNEFGGQPRTLLKEGQYQNFWPLGWSPDGKSVLVSMENKHDEAPRTGLVFAWVSTSDGSLRIIKTLEPWRNSTNTARDHLSPDGKYLAYAASVREGSPEKAIYILSADGATEAVLTRGDTDENPVWTPDGSHILFSSNRSGSVGLWSVPVQDGKRAGVPSLVKADTGKIQALGMTRAGTYYYLARSVLNQVFVAEMDQTGRVRGGSLKVAESFVGIRPRWSRDGKWLAVKRLKNGASNNEHELVIHSMESGAEWAFHPSPMGPGLPQWYLDGTVQPISGNGFRVSMSGGEPKELTTAQPLPLDATLSHDDKLMYRPADRDPQKPRPAGRVGGGRNEGIEVVEMASGERKAFIAFPKAIMNTAPALSPDGRTLVVAVADQGLARIGVDGTDMRTIYTGKFTAYPGSYTWTRDGRAILFGQPSENSVRIMRVSAEGGQPEFTGISGDRLQTFDLSPDGSHIAYEARSDTNYEPWAIDNVASSWSGK